MKLVTAPPHHNLTTRNHRVEQKKQQSQKQHKQSQKQHKQPQKQKSRSTSSPRRRRSKTRAQARAVVQFRLDQNQYYDNTTMTREEIAALWHTYDDFVQFRLANKHCVALVRNNPLIWMDPHSIPATLLRIYNTFATAQTVEDVEPVWNAPQVHHHPGLVGLERTAICAIPVDYGRRRRECLEQIAWLQCQSFRQQADRAALIRLACRQHSRAARLYARFVGDLVARTP